jgi:sugar phosphate isomerase/epimerase
MHLGIFAKTFPRPTLEQTLDAVVDHGLWYVQFNMSCAGMPTLPVSIHENLCRSIAQALRDRGMTMAAISGTFNLCDPHEARLQDNLNRLEVLAAACRWLDTRVITLCTGTRDPNDMWKWHAENVRKSTWETLIQSMKRAVQIADHHEVTLAFEPEIHNVVNSVAKARRLLDEIDSPWLKVVIDPANLIPDGDMSRMTEIFDEAFDWLGSDIVLAHAKNPRDDVDVGELLANGGRLEAILHNIQEVRLPKRAGLDLEADPVEIYLRSRMKSVPDALCEFFFFYSDYLIGLTKIGFSGPVIIHGLPESMVTDMKDFLTHELLRQDRS